ncbi:carboxypeptidase regulatory-like domain-containing protein [candidate division KSB1 bacterium]|nr:carboxypeptidase regulatory-like domain-containing protein [candidate division KSB1 bacterium]
MQAKLTLRYWLAPVVLFSLLFAPFVNASSDVMPVPFEQKMDLALKIWYSEHPDDNLASGVQVVSVAGTGTISGTVSHGNQPIEAAHVFAWAVISNQIKSQSAQTDAAGHYTLENLEAGEYLIVVAAEGYESVFYGGGMNPLDAELVPVQDGESVTGIDFNLRMAKKGAGSISGTVTGNAPLAGAWVVAVTRGNPFGVQSAFAISDVDGSYKIKELPRGAYAVATYAHGYVPEVYDDATSIRDIAFIPVNDDEVTGINFVLEKGGSISGHVQNSEGDPLAQVKVVARAQNNVTPALNIPGLTHLMQLAYTDEHGNYKVEGLAAGDYIVSACLCESGAPGIKYYDDKTDPSEADPVVVTAGQDTPDINFTFTVPTAKISGIVTDTQGIPLKNIYIYYVREDDDVHVNWGRLWKSTLTDENGYYELVNLSAGTYYVSAWFWDKMNFKGIWYIDADSLKNATAIRLTDGEIRDDIDIVLDLTGDYGSISGQVTLESTGDAVPFAFVEAIPLKRNFPSFSPKRLPVMFAFTDDQGHYSLSPLYKGDYYVVVKVNGYREYFDDKQNIADADTVTVTAGADTPGIDFAIPDALSEGSTVSGVVTDDATAEPIAGALVTVFPSIKHRWFNGDLRKWKRVYYTTFTNAEGAYLVGGIPEGEYVVTAWARDYIGEFYDDVRNPLRATIIELDGADAKTGIDFGLTPRSGKKFAQHNGVGRYGSIGGRIQSQDGMPIEGALVFAVDGTGRMVASEMSGEDGSYAIDGLDLDDYKIMASRALFETTYYPNALESSSAATLSITEEDVIDYPDATITLSSGEVTAAEHDIHMTAPDEFELLQNYPNPFNPTTVIEYRLGDMANVSLQVFNVQGQLVKTIVNNVQPAGAYKVSWDGTDMTNAIVPSGVYFYQLTANEYTQIRRLVFMR